MNCFRFGLRQYFCLSHMQRIETLGDSCFATCTFQISTNYGTGQYQTFEIPSFTELWFAFEVVRLSGFEVVHPRFSCLWQDESPLDSSRLSSQNHWRAETTGGQDLGAPLSIFQSINEFRKYLCNSLGFNLSKSFENSKSLRFVHSLIPFEGLLFRRLSGPENVEAFRSFFVCQAKSTIKTIFSNLSIIFISKESKDRH